MTTPADPIERAGRALAATVPTGIALARSAVRRVGASPLARTPLKQLGFAEEVVFRVLKQRLEPPGGQAADGGAPACRRPGEASLSAGLSELLACAIEQSAATGEHALFRRILDRLVPDEAAMIAALAEGGGGPAALVHVVPRARRPDSPHGLENATSLGRRAGTSSQRLVPTYVQHLLELGLVEYGPEEEEMELEFEILMAETEVRDALRRCKTGVMGPRVVRQTLRLSDLGGALWEACRPDFEVHD